MPTTQLHGESFDQAKARRFREEADYFSLATSLARSQAAGLIGVRCGDGFCGAEDCTTCRPASVCVEPIDSDTIDAKASGILTDDRQVLEVVADSLSGEYGTEAGSYLRLVICLARAIECGGPTEFYQRALHKHVMADCKAAAKRALGVRT